MKPLSTGSANGLPFNKDYWDDMYAEDDESVIDGVFNAEGHVRYLFELFNYWRYWSNDNGNRHGIRYL